jgi:hypothetical protein
MRLCVGVSVVSSLCERVVGRAREGNAGTRVFGTEYTDFFLFFFNCSSDSMQLNLPTISIHPSTAAPFRDGAAELSTVSLSPFSLPTFFPPTTRYSTTTTQGNVYNLTYNDIHPSIHLTIDTTANSTSQRHTVKKSRDKKEKTAGIPTFADSKRKLIRLMAPPCPLRLAYVQMPGGAF